MIKKNRILYFCMLIIFILLVDFSESISLNIYSLYLNKNGKYLNGIYDCLKLPPDWKIFKISNLSNGSNFHLIKFEEKEKYRVSVVLPKNPKDILLLNKKMEKFNAESGVYFINENGKKTYFKYIYDDRFLVLSNQVKSLKNFQKENLLECE